jgi:hypothetical protein
MNTITTQFTGAEYEIENLYLALDISNNDMPQQSETRVYVVDTEKYQYEPNMSDEDFITLAEHEATGYNLREFQFAFNYGEVNTFTDVIRFINVPV